MRLLELVQGSKEWSEVRANHYNASEAPVMMGVSKYKTRNQLLAEKKFGKTEEITPAKQALFDKGHKAEEDARSLLELETMDSYLPCVGVLTTKGPAGTPLNLLASFDGRSDDGDHDFEHKLWNKSLAENVLNETLEPSHYWQLEQQLLLSESDYCLFVVSDGTAVNREMMKYYSVPERRESLIAGWEQFCIDLDSYELEAKQEVLVAAQNNFPVLRCHVAGTEIKTNISDCLAEIKIIAEEEKNRPFETDQDFADKDQLNKDVKKLREVLKQNISSVKGAFISYSEFETVANDMDKILQQMFSAGEKQVKQAKESKKIALRNETLAALTKHVERCDELIGAPFSINQIIPVNPDLTAAMKNKRTFDSLKNALDVVLSEWKIALNAATNLIKPNFKYLEENANDYKFLFQDVFSLLNQSEESFNAIVNSRITNHKLIEAENLAIETARIEKEAKEKADAAAEAKLEIERVKIRKEEQDKAQEVAHKEYCHALAIVENNKFDAKAREAVQEKHPENCKGCPDCQGINCEITEQAVKEEFETDNSKVGPGKVFTGVHSFGPVSQLQRNINAIEAQSKHNPLHADFVLWSREYKIDSMAFLALEKLINKHFS